MMRLYLVLNCMLMFVLFVCMLDKIIEQYSQQTTAYYAASRLWVDAIIDPIQTRSVISEGINAANHAPIEKPMNVGVFQV